MTDITIPREALEAAARAALSAIMFEVEPDARANQLTNDEYRSIAVAACLAMLRAWPGMHTHEWHRPWLGGMSGTDIILPLPKKEPKA